jgi:hypothetical protein
MTTTEYETKIQSKLPPEIGYKEKKKPEIDPRNTLNELFGKDWISETKSVWFQKGLGSRHPIGPLPANFPLYL